MKKILALLIAMALIFTFVGCPGTNDPTPDQNQNQNPTPDQNQNQNQNPNQNPNENPNQGQQEPDPEPVPEVEPALPEGWETGTPLDLLTYSAYMEYADEYETYDWIIKDRDGLAKLSELVLAGYDFSDHNVYLEADIDMNPDQTVLDENFDFIGDAAALYNFRPIGDDTSGKKFSGTFDGKNHVIRGLYINIDAEKIKGVGLFGLTGAATIKDLAVIDAYVTVGEGQKNSDISRIGLLVGKTSEETTISNCYGSGFVNGPWLGPDGINGNGVQGTQTADSGYGSEYIGGLVGRADAAVIHVNNCIFNGKIYNAHAATGGIAGRTSKNLTEVDITNCLVMGKSLTCPGGLGTICSTIDVPGNFILDTMDIIGSYKNGSLFITEEMLPNHIEEVTVGNYKIYKMKDYLEEGSATKPEKPAEPENPENNENTGDSGEGTGDAGTGEAGAGAGDAGEGTVEAGANA